jgi:hypothetical protein
MNKHQKSVSFINNKPNEPQKISAGLKNIIDNVLYKKFIKNRRGIKDNCDSCGEKCFD